MATLIKADGTKIEDYNYHGLKAKQNAAQMAAEDAVTVALARVVCIQS